MAAFRWNAWNLEKIARHGVTRAEVEYVVEHAKTPFPKRAREQTWLVIGSTAGGRVLQTVFLYDDDDHDTIFVIHARPLTDREKRRVRRRSR